MVGGNKTGIYSCIPNYNQLRITIQFTNIVTIVTQIIVVLENQVTPLLGNPKKEYAFVFFVL